MDAGVAKIRHIFEMQEAENIRGGGDRVQSVLYKAHAKALEWLSGSNPITSTIATDCQFEFIWYV